MRHLLNPMDFSVSETLELLETSQDILKNPQKYESKARGKILASLFYEPSTRTRLSFESAMISLGGNALGFASADTSSASKGESVADTIRVVSEYSDICAMRHPKEGAVYVAAQYSGIPVINAGDGGHQHPTQTLADLLTIMQSKKRLSGLSIGVCGDLKFGRTVHSLLQSMSRFEGNKFYLVSPHELSLPGYVMDEIILKNKIEYVVSESLEETIGEMDVLYMTRVQRERFFNEADYLRLKDSYIVNRKKLEHARDDLAILHPLPRVNEIAVEVDKDPRAMYFDQVRFGKYVRMALILKLLEVL